MLLKKNPILALAAITMVSGLVEHLPAQATARYQINFTAGARNSKGGNNQIRAAVRNGRNRSNNARGASRTGSILQIAEIRFVNFNDSASGRNVSSAFNALTNGTLSGQRNRESRSRADLAVVITNAQANVRGVGQRPGPYSAVHANYSQRHTQGHETGHNYNAVHGEAHRMVVNGTSFFTMVRTGVASNIVNRIVNRYSNPSVSFRGSSTSCCGRNNAGRMRSQRFTRANRR